MADGELKIKELGPRFKLVREHFEWQGDRGPSSPRGCGRDSEGESE